MQVQKFVADEWLARNTNDKHNEENEHSFGSGSEQEYICHNSSAKSMVVDEFMTNAGSARDIISLRQISRGISSKETMNMAVQDMTDSLRKHHEIMLNCWLGKLVLKKNRKCL